MGHLLIADDVSISRETLSRVLREAGHRVTQAASAEEAVERARADAPDMAILDLNMPRMSGLQATPLIKEAFPGQFVPVMIISGRALGPTEVAEVLHQADDFLRKPYAPAEICARVEVWLRTRRLLDAPAQRGAPISGPAAPESKTIVEPRGPAGLRPQADLLARITEEWRRALRWNQPLGLLLCDLITPPVTLPGEVLQLLGQVATRALRQVDILGQAGGSRLGVLLPNTHPAGALTAAERLRRELMTTPGVPRAALGMALVPGKDIASPEDLLQAAELALLRAQAEGPFSLCVHQHQGYLVRAV